MGARTRRLFLALLAAAAGARTGFADDVPSDRELVTGLRTALDEQQKAGGSKNEPATRERAIQLVVAALDRVTERSRTRAGAPPEGPEAADLAKLIVQACGIELPNVLRASWRAAAWFGHPATAAAFGAQGERLTLRTADDRRAYLATAKEAPSLETRRAFVA